MWYIEDLSKVFLCFYPALLNVQTSQIWKGYRVGQKKIKYLFLQSSYRPLFKCSNTKSKVPDAPSVDLTVSPCSLVLPSTKQVNMAQHSNVSNSARPWNYACLMLTLETQLNSSVLNQSRAARMNMHFDWVSRNHNLLSQGVWQPPAV